MNIIATARAATEAAITNGSLHDASEGVSAWTAAGAVVSLLIIIVGSLLLLVRRSDLEMIREAKISLDRLVKVVEDFRSELSTLRVELAIHYVSKGEFEKLEQKVEKLREHMVIRGGERRIIDDSET